MIELLANWLANQGVDAMLAVSYARWIAAGVTLLLAVLAYTATRWMLLPALGFYFARTDNAFDNAVTDREVSQRLLQLAPALVIYLLLPVVFEGYAVFVNLAQKALLIFIIVVSVLAVRGVLNAMLRIYQGLQVGNHVPLRSFFQLIEIMAFFTAALLILAVLVDRTPLYLLSGLGAIMAILTIVFRDPLLGLVAGVQLTADDLVSRGDWIELPKFDATGEVLDVALTTVKIRNADQSITTVPTYSLISESFKNWRGIDQTGARFITRAIHIDANSVRFCTPEMLARYRQIPLVDAALTAGNGAAQQAVDVQGELEAADAQTNLGVYRLYVTAYLRRHPQLHQHMTLLVRQQDPTPLGLPLQVLAYSKETDFAAYETLQAEIVEHLLATAPAFDLRVFQSPTGSDLQVLADRSLFPQRG